MELHSFRETDLASERPAWHLTIGFTSIRHEATVRRQEKPGALPINARRAFPGLLRVSEGFHAGSAGFAALIPFKRKSPPALSFMEGLSPEGSCRLRLRSCYESNRATARAASTRSGT